MMNPFKLWGSYVGAVIGLLVVLLPRTKLIFINPIFILLDRGIIISCDGMAGILCLWILRITTPIVFFFIGYGAHLLVSRLIK